MYKRQIKDDDFTALAASPRRARFLSRSDERPPDCPDCPYRQLCNGGCPRDRVWQESGVRHVYCAALRSFFTYALPRLSRIARMEAGYE